MACRFECVAPVEGVVRDGAHVHEATLEVVDHVVEPRFGVQPFRLSQLDFVDVDPDDSDSGLADYTAHRAADPATDIDHRHTLAQLQFVDHRSLMADFGVLHALAGRQWREVKGFAPAEHHELAAKVVVFLDGLGCGRSSPHRHFPRMLCLSIH